MSFFSNQEYAAVSFDNLLNNQKNYVGQRSSKPAIQRCLGKKIV